MTVAERKALKQDIILILWGSSPWHSISSKSYAVVGAVIRWSMYLYNAIHSSIMNGGYAFSDRYFLYRFIIFSLEGQIIKVCISWERYQLQPKASPSFRGNCHVIDLEIVSCKLKLPTTQLITPNTVLQVWQKSVFTNLADFLTFAEKPPPNLLKIHNCEKNISLRIFGYRSRNVRWHTRKRPQAI